MNRERRRKIKDIIGDLEILRDRLVEVCEEEQDAFDNTPEQLQKDETEEIISNLEECGDRIDDVISDLEDTI